MNAIFKMNTPTVLSDSSPRQKRGKKKLFLKSCGIRSHNEILDSSNCQRSSSLSTLVGQGNINLSGSPGTESVRPRMAQLETLEAKMAHIEVSLSVTPRRKRGGSVGGGSLGGGTLAPSTPVPAPIGNRMGRDMIRDLRNMLPNKDATEHRALEQTLSTMSLNRSFVSVSQEKTTPDLVAAVPPCNNNIVPDDYYDVDEFLEERATAIRQQIESKRCAIKNLKLALEGLDITDNIDVRIQQAELEYRLGREELELLTLHEQGRALNAMLAEKNEHENEDGTQKQTLFTCVSLSENQSIIALEIDHDPKCPRFGAGSKRSLPGLWVEWAVDQVKLRKGDRLIEVNGKLVVSCRSKEDLCRLLSISPSPAQLVVLRSAASAVGSINGHHSQINSLKAKLGNTNQLSEVKHSREGLQADNLRLTHRISYLEEQVAELLAENKTPILETEKTKLKQRAVASMSRPSMAKENETGASETSVCNSFQPKQEVQFFQKGPDITAIVANLPGLNIGAQNTAKITSTLPIIRPKSNVSIITNSQNLCISKNNRPHSVNSAGNSDYDCRNDYTHGQNYQKSPRCLAQLKCSKNTNSADTHTERKYTHNTSGCYIGSKNEPQDNIIDYNAETSAALEIIKRNQRHYLDKVTFRNIKRREPITTENPNKNIAVQQAATLSNVGDCNLPKFKSMHDYNTTENEYKQDVGNNELNISKSIYQYQFDHKNLVHRKSKMYCKKNEQNNSDFNPDNDNKYKKIDGKIIESTHKSSRRHSKVHTRSVKSLDFDSENSDSVHTSFSNNFHQSTKSLSDPNSSVYNNYRKYFHNIKEDVCLRPAAPKKPLRLSLHRVQSSQSDCDRHKNNYTEKNSVTIEKNVKCNSLNTNITNSIDVLKNTPSDQKYRHPVLKRESMPFDLSPLVTRKPTKRSFKGNTFQIGDSKNKICTKSLSAIELNSNDSFHDQISPDNKYEKKYPINTSTIPLVLNSNNTDNNRSKTQNSAGYNLIRWSLSTNKPLVHGNNAKYNDNLSDGEKLC